MENHGFVIIIPAYNPDIKLISLIKSILSKNQNQKLIIVNDGSDGEHSKIFERIKNQYDCIILHHAVNLGKGRALKNAFNYFLNNFSGYSGAITADADGQHNVDDIFSCGDKLIKSPHSLILGVRDFDKKVVPFKSQFGNKITRWIFRFLCGVNLSDTQTGLRAISTDFMKNLLNVSGERFEFEMNMLIETKKENVDIIEIPIKTIYVEENKSSHFNPLVDSLRIYSVFLKFIFSSLSSCGVDLLLFFVFSNLLHNLISIQYIFIATVLARVFSSTFNYLINKNSVFLSESKLSLVKYYILAIVQMTISGLAVSLLVRIGLNSIVSKILVDLVLFVISFQIQRNWVFLDKKEEKQCV